MFASTSRPPEVVLSSQFVPYVVYVCVFHFAHKLLMKADFVSYFDVMGCLKNAYMRKNLGKQNSMANLLLMR